MDRPSATEYYSPERDPFQKFEALNITEPDHSSPINDRKKELQDNFILKKVQKRPLLTY